MFAVSTSVPTTILMVYMILSQLLTSRLIVENFMQYIAISLMLVGFIRKIITLATVCENGEEQNFFHFAFSLSLCPKCILLKKGFTTRMTSAVKKLYMETKRMAPHS